MKHGNIRSKRLRSASPNVKQIFRPAEMFQSGSLRPVQSAHKPPALFYANICLRLFPYTITTAAIPRAPSIYCAHFTPDLRCFLLLRQAIEAQVQKSVSRSHWPHTHTHAFASAKIKAEIVAIEEESKANAEQQNPRNALVLHRRLAHTRTRARCMCACARARSRSPLKPIAPTYVRIASGNTALRTDRCVFVVRML